MSTLTLVTTVNALLYLAASLFHTGVTLPLGSLVIGFPRPVRPRRSPRASSESFSSPRR